MISHRRIRSDSATHPPSKLSNFTSAPLTPTIEEGRTPGGRVASGNQGSPGGAGGFFSSVFSAAQNAANTLSNTIANNQTRSRSGTQDSEIDENNGIDEPTAVVSQAESGQLTQQKQLAVATLGSGDLSLSHLGISSDTLASDPDGVSAVQRDEAAARAEDVFAARAVSAAYSEKRQDDGTAASIGGDTAVNNRPGSTYESSVAGEKTPPNGSVFEGNHGLPRSGSVRSRVGGVVRRHRNSSSATGATVGAAIGAGHAALANPAANSSVPKLTGFAVASKKRNRDFHQLFRSVPEDDYLIEDYSCALQREIILAGRIYVSEGHICFSSNILGWVTTLIISFDEVVSIEKESTAVVFPNAIAIQTLHARHTFRSLLSREATYDLMVGIWKISHPSLKSSLNGVRLVEGGTGDKTEKVEPSGSEGGSDDSEEDDGIYDEDEDDDGDGSFIEAGDGSIAGSEAGESTIKSVSRKTSAIGVAAGMAAGSVPTAPPAKAVEKAGVLATTAAADFPGPATHAPTECGDADTHYDIVIGDDIIPAPLGKVYSMMFGPASGGFLSRWLLDEQKVTDLQMEDDKKGLSDEVRSRSYSYIKPLGGSIGPKQTKCLINETIEAFDLEKAITITSSTQTPDVPSGNVFSTKTKYCLTWAPANSTRVQMNCMIEWTGKSWLKSTFALSFSSPPFPDSNPQPKLTPHRPHRPHRKRRQRRPTRVRHRSNQSPQSRHLLPPPRLHHRLQKQTQIQTPQRLPHHPFQTHHLRPLPHAEKGRDLGLVGAATRPAGSCGRYPQAARVRKYGHRVPAVPTADILVPRLSRSRVAQGHVFGRGESGYADPGADRGVRGDLAAGGKRVVGLVGGEGGDAGEGLSRWWAGNGEG